MVEMGRFFEEWDGDYIKTLYDVLLPDGEIIYKCWPNAGKMLECGGQHRQWLPEDGIQVRKSVKKWYEDLGE